MTTEHRLRFAVDHGTATVAAALLAELDGRWRLLAAGAVPAAVGADALLIDLLHGVRTADATLGHTLPPAGRAPGLPRHESRSAPPPTVAILGASDRRRDSLAVVARSAGLRVPADGPTGHIVDAIGAALRPEVGVVIAGSGRSPTADERGRTDELLAAVASIATRRPDLTIVVSGALASRASAVAPEVRLVSAAPAGESAADDLALRETLLEVALAPDATRRGIAAAIGDLALLLERRVEVVEVGADGGLRALAWPSGEGAVETEARVAVVADGALVPPVADDGVVDAIAAWSTMGLDRVRLRDRLAELRAVPWGEADGEGALLRLAAARAAVGRIVAAAPDFDALPSPDLVIAAGGAWMGPPPPAVALALIDVIRRPGAVQLSLDHARLLGPLGLIADPEDRRSLLAGAVDDLLLPLGSAIVPRGLRPSRGGPGRLVLRHADGTTVSVELEANGVQLVDLPPGAEAVAELDLRDAADLGTRGRRFAMSVSGGLGGLLVDLRDIPIRLPSRLDRRREQLAAWQRPLWPEAER